MYDLQQQIFRNAAQWSALTSLVVFAFGVLCNLQGFRFARFHMALICFAGGFVSGSFAAIALDAPALPAGIFAGAVFAVITLVWLRVGIMLAAMFLCALGGQYLGTRFGVSEPLLLVLALVGGAFGTSLRWICLRRLPVLLTAAYGSALLIVGFVGVAFAVAPSIGWTFVEYADRYALMVPVLMTMLVVMGNSLQETARQGNTQSGGARDLAELEST